MCNLPQSGTVGLWKCVGMNVRTSGGVISVIEGEAIRLEEISTWSTTCLP